MHRLVLSCIFALVYPALAIAQDSRHAPILIQEQGSFTAGGTIATASGEYDPGDFRRPAGQSTYADHAYVFYQKPVNARRLPLVFLHGGFQSSKTWESTPDGREGFQNIFLRRRFSVYLVDQPRRGKAGQTSLPFEVTPSFVNIMFHTLFRLGNYPDLFPGVQFPKDQESRNQYFRQITPNTGPLDLDVVADSMVALFDKIGPGILVTHSQGGSPGWFTAIRSENVHAIVSYEPGGSPFVFPEGEVPEPIETSFGVRAGRGIPLEDFTKLTRIPIIIYYGDNIATAPTPQYGMDQWRAELQLAREFVATINRYGGDATVVHLPEIGIAGNTHFPFSDLNNIEIADLLSGFLAGKNLDGNDLEGDGGACQTVTRAGSQPSGKGSSNFFTGNVRIDPLFRVKEDAPFSSSYVTFEPGSRSFWHTHPTGQHLVVVSGVGRTGTWDGEVEEIKAGDVVWCPPGVKHWHGASPASAMTHLTVTGSLGGKNVEWMEAVTDEQYGE